MEKTPPQSCDPEEVEGRLAECTPRSPIDDGPTDRHRIVGTLVVRQHCQFIWHQEEGQTHRVVTIVDQCRDCRRALWSLIGEDLLVESVTARG